jgi:hypothetical protein
MKRYLALAALALAPQVWSQELKLTVFDRLKDKASEVTNLNLPKSVIDFAGGILGGGEDGAKLKKLVDGLQGILVRSLEFDKEGAYTKADVQSLISEMGGPGWNLIISADENHGQEISRIWIRTGGNGELGGMRILSAESKELSVIEINGKIRVEDLKQLEGLGIPNINLGSEHTGNSTKKKEE